MRFSPCGVPPKFAAKSRAPPMWSLTSTDCTCGHGVDAVQDRTMIEPMSASRFQASAVGDGEADSDAEAEGPGDRTTAAAELVPRATIASRARTSVARRGMEDKQIAY